jgi:hypothetical protein
MSGDAPSSSRNMSNVSSVEIPSGSQLDEAGRMDVQTSSSFPTVLRNITNQLKTSTPAKSTKNIYSDSWANIFFTGKELSPESMQILEPPEPVTRKRKYKPRDNVYLLATAKHRETKNPPKKQPLSKVKTNCASSPTELDAKCKFCSLLLQNEQTDGVKKRIILVKCVSCELWMHEKCIPKRAKLANPYVASRIIAGVKFDFVCCKE